MSNNIAKADFPGQISRVEAVPLQPHEIVGDLSICEFSSKEDIPSSIRYIGMETTEIITGVEKKYRLKTGILNSNWEPDLNKDDVGLDQVDNTSDIDKPVSTATQLALNNKVNIFQSTSVIHDVTGGITLDFDSFQFYEISMETDITSLSITGGNVGMIYQFLITQSSGGNHLLDLASPYPSTGTNISQGELYIHEYLDGNGYIEMTRVYSVVSDYSTIDIDTDIDNGDLIPVYFLPDGVKPFLSTIEGRKDMFSITVVGVGKYVITQTSSNM
ncbi:MAG: hypothetical protein CL843_09515 [Crocinitomicaceae bacterium]|nr:hypothetical protein [Crocinitomicaceae bacterium]|tara:strand:+ start:2853 stop:3671 length:819 start_codon:yes stop_codon:yes gene_type:complete